MLLVAALAGLASPQAPPPAPPPIVRREPARRFLALELLSAVPERLGEELGELDVRVQVLDEGPRRAIVAGAAGWLRELFAPLADPACRPVAAAARLPDLGPAIERLASLWPDGRPIASPPGGEPVLIASTYPPPAPEDLEMLRAAGLLPLEVALAGEWARAVAARHAGPPPRDPALRHARAARLEGAARVAGILVAAKGAGLTAGALGSALLEADRDRAGWPREALLAAAAHPVHRAFLLVLLEDGPRWAAAQTVAGGTPRLVAALERPGGDAHALLHPNGPAPPAAAAAGCRLGPRPTAALLGAAPDAPWIDRLQDESVAAGEESGVRGRLLFDGPSSAARAAADLTAAGCRVSLRNARLEARCAP